MKLINLAPLFALVATSNAQTAPGFALNVTTNLRVTYLDTNTSVTPPGVLLDRSRILNTPTVSLPTNASVSSQYIVLMIDQDITGANGTKSSRLHWFQPNLAIGRDGATLAVFTVNTSSAVGAVYNPPTPPAGSGPHSYDFLLFVQPSNFTVPAAYAAINPAVNATARALFNVTDFIRATGLNSPIAANYLRTLNGTTVESSSAATMTYMSSTMMGGGMTATAGSGSMTASASAATTTASRAVAVEFNGHSKDVMMSLVLGVLGAGLWMV